MACLTSLEKVVPNALAPGAQDGRLCMILNRAGDYRFAYEDTLRAVGHYLDVNLYRNVTIVELPEGLLAKGTFVRFAHRGTRLHVRSHLFSNAEIERTLEDAYARRGSGAVSPSTPSTSSREPLTNQNMLRVAGRVIDEEKWHDIVVTQVPDGIRIKALVRPQTTEPEDHQVIDVFLADTEMRRWIDELRAGRRPTRD